MVGAGAGVADAGQASAHAIQRPGLVQQAWRRTGDTEGIPEPDECLLRADRGERQPAEVSKCLGLRLPVADIAGYVQCPGEADGRGRIVTGLELHATEIAQRVGLALPIT